MKCIEIAQPGPAEGLVLAERPDPTPGPDEVVIEVMAAGVNRPDVLQRLGVYPPPPGASDIPGLEVAGRIVALGADVVGWQEGAPVCALVAGGGYAERCVAPAATLLPWPEGYDAVQAAALPETVFTVWSNVFERGALAPGETLLVHGGTSGIGTMAIQLAKAFGAQVAITAGSDEKCAFCRDLGADLAVNYKTDDFVDAVKAFTNGDGADVILDMVGGDYVARNMKCLAVGGRHVTIAFLNGAKANINLATLMINRQTLTGSTLRAREIAFKAAIAGQVSRLVWPLLAAGRVRPVIDSTYPLASAAEAHRRMESSAHMGKIVLTP
ncbi:putative PIG3 family NAD(P)H quinone oxidoreductase [Rhodothalassium salexigens DSM 2132]|uniref:Putative PIG3 family NAD(P)H quinone oxidoreductase n=1 Tax=Rhodothalassium salexigens DSM 2132 TaxID=1188247 RepID=A0A4R2PRL2_RHOSA|nr:NAD(P)H-quinone oxidoreductase [Rhodothalassium salexigens]MBB4210296.1 putative PIG3 family NAD(P)H quinone oxidoreductase [Rhodothalassium salexigens DSM 2132]MBK1639205.1 NAD(P)H-quinone oxidoreductase [Rhodothalassium salexigens DSM 2132]TCP38460.1 putative PIG3 family NAD(P)H quinone oxidoreductase [Rhodothalassium salexigens DSM 2132]